MGMGMPRGPSGRVVVQLDVTLKKELHATLAREGSTLKEWLTRVATEYIQTCNHLNKRVTPTGDWADRCSAGGRDVEGA